MIEDSNIPTKVNRERFYKLLTQSPLTGASLDFIGTIIAVFLLFLLAIKPTILTIKKIQLSITNLQNFNNTLQDKVNTLQILAPIYQDNISQLQLLTAAIPDQAEFPVFEKQLRFLIQRNNIQLLSLSFSEFPILQDSGQTADEQPTDATQENQDSSNIPSINFTLAAKGDYATIKSFVSQMQNLSRVVVVESITISQGIADTDQVTFNLKGKAYYSPDTIL